MGSRVRGELEGECDRSLVASNRKISLHTASQLLEKPIKANFPLAQMQTKRTVPDSLDRSRARAEPAVMPLP